MKKRSLVVGMVLVMTAAMASLTGCGSSKEDYLNDVEQMTENATDPSKMDMKTSEGKQLKKDLEEMQDADSDEAIDMLSDYLEDVQEFMDAAEDAGVDDEDLTGLE